ncbi:hypothetical protein ACH5RR_028671 [Cinchona calisaya]|uniref:O-methyltransferase C-terminal domain-containing protein n=1 Tax=Cinchona calisaya TaxID=153742 RepID=A0ABD2YPG0_9GENT
MASDVRLISSLVIKNWKDIFLGLNSLVDVGGGTGTLAEAIADAFPHLNSAVLDLPHVVGGDMFAATPPTDAFLLKSYSPDSHASRGEEVRQEVILQYSHENPNRTVVSPCVHFGQRSVWPRGLLLENVVKIGHDTFWALMLPVSTSSMASDALRYGSWGGGGWADSGGTGVKVGVEVVVVG